MPETELELGVKQVVEKQESISHIREKPSSGGGEQIREVLRDVDDEGINDIGGKGDGNESTNGISLEELLQVREAFAGQNPDQISICSLDYAR